MKLQSVELDHTRDGLRRWGRNVARWEGEADVGEVHRLLTAAFVCLLCFSVRRFTSLGVHFKRSSFAFLGSFLLGITGAKHGKESRGAECTVGVPAG